MHGTPVSTTPLSWVGGTIWHCSDTHPMQGPPHVVVHGPVKH